MRDATLSAPALSAGRPARPAPRAVSAGDTRSRKRPGGRRLPARLSVIVGSAGFCAIMIGIVINATMFQKGHHPAPLFASTAPARPAIVEPPPAVIPLAVAPPVAAPVMPAPVEKRPVPLASPPVKPAAGPGVAAPSKAKSAGHGDGIARLLGTLAAREPVRAAKPPAPAHAKVAAVKPAAVAH